MAGLTARRWSPRASTRRTGAAGATAISDSSRARCSARAAAGSWTIFVKHSRAQGSLTQIQTAGSQRSARATRWICSTTQWAVAGTCWLKARTPTPATRWIARTSASRTRKNSSCRRCRTTCVRCSRKTRTRSTRRCNGATSTATAFRSRNASRWRSIARKPRGLSPSGRRRCAMLASMKTRRSV